jgi:hypothetical protein
MVDLADLSDGQNQVTATGRRLYFEGSPGVVLPGSDQPCRARPADWSLVAEDRGAGGVRDRQDREPHRYVLVRRR